MGKMMEALRKAETMKHPQAQVQLPVQPVEIIHHEDHAQDHSFWGQPFAQAVVIIVFLVIGVTSIIFNFTTVSELKKTKQQSGQMSAQLQEHTQHMNKLTEQLAALTAQSQEKAGLVASLQRDVGRIQQSAIGKEKEMSALMSQNQQLQGDIATLTAQNKSLSKRQEDLSHEVGKLKGFIQDMHTMVANPVPAAVGGKTKENPAWEN